MLPIDSITFQWYSLMIKLVKKTKYMAKGGAVKKTKYMAKGGPVRQRYAMASKRKK